MVRTYSESSMYGYATTNAVRFGGHTTFYEFTGTGSTYVDVKDQQGNYVYCLGSSIQLTVLGRRWPSSWFTVSTTSNGTRITLAGSRTFPDGSDCAVMYRPRPLRSA